jgi:ABC transporter
MSLYQLASRSGSFLLVCLFQLAWARSVQAETVQAETVPSPQIKTLREWQVPSTQAALLQLSQNLAEEEITITGSQEAIDRPVPEYIPQSGVQRSEFENRNNRRLGDIIERLPGVTVDGPPGENKDVRLRGLDKDVRENIAYGNPQATISDIETAAKSAYAHEFIQQLPQGYDTIIGERGVKLSGGQRQRLAIARALMASPQFLILDEATAALDTESEHLIQQALQILLRDRTCLVIAHRLSTVRNADRIVVLEAGQIREIGTHAELQQKGNRYAKIYDLQFPQRANNEAL